MKTIELFAIGALIVGWIGTGHAADPEQKCLAGRAKAKGAYEDCVQKVLAKTYPGTFLNGDDLPKCVTKYDTAWTKLKALVGSATCSGLDRFVDNGTTVTDRLTMLTWEKKSGASDDAYNYSDPRDPDNSYALTFDNDDDGGAYYDFLGQLNAGTGFANANGWRLPTLPELLTIRNRAEIGPYYPSWYWSQTLDQTNEGQAWRVHFGDTPIMTAPKWGVNMVRAVRGGL